MSAFEPFEKFDEVDDIIDRLEDPDPGTRRVAIMDLADSADPAAVAHLKKALADDAREVRLQIALALGEFDGPETAEALLIALTDADSGVAQAAADSMADE
ncbi:MAG: HEAT repeat domain-containing protein, partial [Rhodospirillales bacterium]